MLPKMHPIRNGPPRDDFKLSLTYRRDPKDDPHARVLHDNANKPYGSGEQYTHLVDFTVDIDGEERRLSVWILGYHSEDPAEWEVVFWAEIELVDDWYPGSLCEQLLVGIYSFRKTGNRPGRTGFARIADKELVTRLAKLLITGE